MTCGGLQYHNGIADTGLAFLIKKCCIPTVKFTCPWKGQGFAGDVYSGYDTIYFNHHSWCIGA